MATQRSQQRVIQCTGKLIVVFDQLIDTSWRNVDIVDQPPTAGRSHHNDNKPAELSHKEQRFVTPTILSVSISIVQIVKRMCKH